MPYAKGQGLHQINAPLTNLSVQYANNLTGFINNKFPTIQVQKESDAYYIYGREHFKIPQTIRANGSPANSAEYTVSTSTYTLEEHALRDVVTDRDRGNADAALQPDIDAMENLVSRIMLRKEIQARNLLFTTTNFTNSHSLTSTLGWQDLTTISDPIGDIQTATSIILTNTGKRPNTLVVGYNAFNKGLRNHPNIIERIKYSERAIISEDIVAAVFGIQNIWVGEAVQNTAAEGAAADSMAYIWATDAWVGYLEPNAKLKSASAVYNFTKGGNGAYPYAVKKYRDEEVSGDWVEVSSFFDTRAVATLSGYLIKGVD